MNLNILESLDLLTELSKSKALPIKHPDRFELDLIIKGLFYCLNDKVYHQEFPEKAAITDTEWLCANEGAIVLTDELNEVTIKRPYCCQFIGLSGKTYLWFQPGNYKTKRLKLCTLGSTCNTLVVHNIAADRPMFTEAWLSNTNNGVNFFCTMSAHLLCAGVSDQQSYYYSEGQTGPRAGGLKNLVDTYNFWSATEWPEVMELNAPRGKAEVASKKIRNIFYKGTLAEINASLVDLISYAIEDVNKTFAIFRNIFPAWLNALPSKESQYFYLKRAKVNYSIPSYFKDWFIATEAKYQAIKAEIKALVKENNENKVKEFLDELKTAQILAYTFEELPAKYKNKAGTQVLKKWNNPWLLAQELNPEVISIIDRWNNKYPAVNWKLDKTGFPLWYLNCDDSADSPICQLLLDASFITSEGPQPITYDKTLKFVYLRNGATIKITSPKKGLNTKDNCGSILSKDFIPYWENGTFTTHSESAKKIVNKMSEISYWTSVRSRLAELVVLSEQS
jgi:hypothetical protein